MASILAIDPACDAVAAKLRTAAALIGRIVNADGSLRLYPNAQGDVPQRPLYPYLRVEAAGETSLHTMGPVTGPKFGAQARVRVRVATQATQVRGDAETRQISSLVKQALDCQPITVDGFATAGITFEGITPMEDLVAGIITREWISEFEVTVHQ